MKEGLNNQTEEIIKDESGQEKNIQTPEEAIEEITKKYESKGGGWKVKGFKVSENQKLVACVEDFYKYGDNFPSSYGSRGYNKICIRDLENSQTKHTVELQYHEDQTTFRSNEILGILNISNDGKVTIRMGDGESTTILPNEFYPES